VIAALLIAGMLTVTDPQPAVPVTVSPAHVELVGIAPGVQRAAQVKILNSGTQGAVLTVSGQLHSAAGTVDADLLRVDVSACSQPWTGLPDAPACPADDATTPSVDLAAVQLPPAAATYVLISAGLDTKAGPGAAGQTWTAVLELTAVQSVVEPPAAGGLAFTGAQPIGTAAAAAVLIGAGALLVSTRRRAQRRSR
jgi:hypothetical protein